MTHVELFAGIGGISIAAEWAGFRTVAQVERDPYCLKILEKHWPDVHRVKDIRDFPDQDYGAVTLVSGGFPCQPFSAAGKRRGAEDDRYLWPEMRRVIAEVKPTWIVAENVAGLTSMAQFDSLPELGPSAGDRYRIGDVYRRTGPGILRTILEEIEALGYEVTPIVVPAAGTGAPHYRYRVFIVAYAQKRQNNGRKRRIVDEKMERTESSNTSADIGGQDVADTGRSGRIQPQEGRREAGERNRNGGQDVAYTTGERLERGSESERNVTEKADGFLSSRSGANVADTERERFNYGNDGKLQRQSSREKHAPASTSGDIGELATGWWGLEPGVGRVAHGVSKRVDRLRCLGNAVVPAQVYPILQAIAEVER